MYIAAINILILLPRNTSSTPQYRRLSHTDYFLLDKWILPLTTDYL